MNALFALLNLAPFLLVGLKKCIALFHFAFLRRGHQAIDSALTGHRAIGDGLWLLHLDKWHLELNAELVYQVFVLMHHFDSACFRTHEVWFNARLPAKRPIIVVFNLGNCLETRCLPWGSEHTRYVLWRWTDHSASLLDGTQARALLSLFNN